MYIYYPNSKEILDLIPSDLPGFWRGIPFASHSPKNA